MTGKPPRRSSFANRVDLTLLGRVALGTAALFAVWAVRPLWGPLWHGLHDWWAPVAALTALAVSTALFAVRDRRNPAERADTAEPLRSLTSRSIAFGAVALATVGFVAAVLLLRTASGPGAAERLEAIKTAATLVAGAGGGAALLLAARRQRSTELTLVHQQRVAQLTEHDAAERRLTELYLKAVEQLGSPHAAVRHGGLYALERVAQDNPHQRQTVVSVVCAYLRRPYTDPATGAGRRTAGIQRPVAGSSTAGPHERHEEREVRLTAQRILQGHLRVGSEKFWPDIDLDLTGATLIELDLADCRLRAAKFTGATLIGTADFNRAAFEGKTSFSEARFNGYAMFHQTRFLDESRFEEVNFHRSANFTEAIFSARTWFIGATFNNDAWFDQTTFTAGANFWKNSFDGYVGLRKSRFDDDANFTKCTFAEPAMFTDTKFSGAVFRRSIFASLATFTNTSFGNYAWFENANFLSLTNFRSAEFAVPPKFEGATFAHRAPELAEFLATPPSAPEQTGPPAS